MKLNINVLIGCALCVVLIGVFGALNRTADSRDDWRPSEAYSRVGGSAYSAVSYSAASSSADGLSAPAVSMRGGNSMFRRRTVFSYAPAYSAPTSLIASSPYHLGASASNSAASALYTTSSATAKSFGSGNALSGVSMSGGVVRATNSQSPVSNSQLSIANIQSPIAYTQLPTTEVQSPIAANYQGIGNATAGGPRAMRGRQNVGGPSSSNGYDVWLEWLDNYAAEHYGESNVYTYDYDAAYAAFLAWFEATHNGTAYDEYTGGDPKIFFDIWWDWCMRNGGSHKFGDNTHNFLPIGDCLPLLMLGIIYFVIVFIRNFKKRMNSTMLK